MQIDKYNYIVEHINCNICRRLTDEKFSKYVTQLLETIAKCTKVILECCLLQYGQSNLVIYQTLLDYLTFENKYAKLVSILQHLQTYFTNINTMYQNGKTVFIVQCKSKKVELDFLSNVRNLTYEIYIKFPKVFFLFFNMYDKMLSFTFIRKSKMHERYYFIIHNESIFSQLVTEYPQLKDIHQKVNIFGTFSNLQELGFVDEHKEYILRILSGSFTNHYAYVKHYNPHNILTFLLSDNNKKYYLDIAAFVEVIDISNFNLKLIK